MAGNRKIILPRSAVSWQYIFNIRKLVCLASILLLIGGDANAAGDSIPLDPVLPKHTKDITVVGTGRSKEEVAYLDIDPNQPISIGEVIYSEEDVTRHGVNFYSTVSISYVYLGIENNSVKLKRTDYSSDSTGNNREKNNIILLPLNEHNQALLEVSPPTRRLKAAKLIITVTDNSDKIKVEQKGR